MTASCRLVRVGVGLVAALTLVASACSSSSSSKSSTPGKTTSTGTANLTLLGPVKRASGTPLEIGYIYAGQSEAIDGQPELAIAQATVKYVNEHLGGVAGRPLKLVVCADGASPAGASGCANQMIAAKVPVVLSAAPGQPATVIKALEPAKIPYFLYAGLDQSVLLSPDGYVVTDPLASLAVPIKLAKDTGVKKAAMVLIDLPAAVGPVKSIATPLFNKAGVSVSYTAIAPGTPDMTPQMQAALSNGAQQFSIIGDATFCISALGALKTLGFKGTIMINSQCLSPDVAKSVPGGIDGVKIATSESLDPKDPEVALYEAVAAKYAPGTPPHLSGNSGGYGAVMGFARAMQGFGAGDVSAATIAQTLTSMPPRRMPLLGKQTFRCDRTTPLTPAVCSTGAVILTVDASGNAKNSVSFDATPYIKLG